MTGAFTPPPLAALLGAARRDRAALDRVLRSLSPEAAEAWLKDWGYWGRADQQPPQGDDWDTWLILAGRGYGKALALDTPIPTPSGWTSNGDLRDGDHVFGDDGAPCRVVKAHPVLMGRPCFRVVFSDGSEIVADAEHLWMTSDRRTRKALRRRATAPGRQDRPQCVARYAPAVRTTAEIAATLTDGREANHSVECAGALRLPSADLPIDPYLLGCWLGDGSSSGAEITTMDAEIAGAFAAAGHEVRPYAQAGRATTYGIVGGGFRAALRALGVLGDKHVPLAYLRASAPQRRALLAGLMDTDGCAAPGGHVEFCGTRERLCRDVFELAVSLGFKPSWVEGRATLGGRDCGPKYRVLWTPHEPVFRLPRKLARQHTGKAQAARTRRRYIVAVEPIPSVPVRCITVDSPTRLYLAGRAMIPTHNTRTGAEWVRALALAGKHGRIALVAETAADARDVMVEGESGLLAVHTKAERPLYEPSKRRITWSNGVVATLYNGTEPDQLRGPQHHAAWVDELAKYQYAQAAWDQLQFGLRLGSAPKACVTTTPRAIPLIKALVADPRTRITRGRTLDNTANLAPSFQRTIMAKYSGTRLGRQELEAEILPDVAGGLWRLDIIDRITPDKLPVLQRVIVAVDPAVTAGEESDEVGLVVVGLGADQRGYVIHDASAVMTPADWARKANALVQTYDADCIVAEANQGGLMVQQVLRAASPAARVKLVHATKGKAVRAEPIAAMYEQGRISHVGMFSRLEDQMLAMSVAGYVGGDGSPDRLDALVWGLTELMPAIVRVERPEAVRRPTPQPKGPRW